MYARGSNIAYCSNAFLSQRPSTRDKNSNSSASIYHEKQHNIFFFLQEASNSQHSPALTSSLCKHYKWHVLYLITLSASSEGSGAPEEQEKTTSQVGVNKTMMNSFIFWVKP